ncbi:MAG: efflux transporter outer membrane subunit [Deltaproteobacteria bacterium]|nr:efflux transporter outer membrane subunit [Deltaproteobacteria bacterium]MBW2048129.1 efflux transporter outer membrane subunit [Deltaproteobacteria bacterium]MBW2110869.1 efflux transporter outer membrane subunit [Deltaproteobacteria bacterium]
MSSRLLYFSILMAGVCLVAGACIKMGPDFKKPDPPIKEPQTFQYAPERPVPAEPEDRWWETFGDPALDRVVENALKHNLDLQQASARILELKYGVIQARSGRYPAIGLQIESQRQHQPEAAVGPGRSIGGTTDNYNFSLPASFELDLWGKFARAEEASQADLLQGEEARWTLAQSLVAEAVTLYLKMESIERRIQITRESLENYQESVTFVERRYKRGLTSILDLRQARRTLAQAQSNLPLLIQELGATQQALAVLLGRYPETRPPREQPEDYFKKLAPVPPGLPSELLMRRPDIRAAEARLKALNALVGVSKASRFPSISLTGSFGYSSSALGSLFSPDVAWSVGAGLFQPLFDAGRLKAGQRAAEARYAQGLAEYTKVVLGAFSEVEKALLTRKKQMERRKEVMRFLLEARATQRVAEARYVRGLVDYLTVLNAQQTRFKAEDDLVLVDFAILSNRVTLHRALGGGWAQPPPVKGKGTEGFDSFTIW